MKSQVWNTVKGKAHTVYNARVATAVTVSSVKVHEMLPSEIQTSEQHQYKIVKLEENFSIEEIKLCHMK